MTAIELIQSLMQVNPMAEVLCVHFDPTTMEGPQVIGADMYILQLEEGVTEIDIKESAVFIGSPSEFHLIMHLVNEE